MKALLRLYLRLYQGSVKALSGAANTLTCAVKAEGSIKALLRLYLRLYQGSIKALSGAANTLTCVRSMKALLRRS